MCGSSDVGISTFLDFTHALFVDWEFPFLYMCSGLTKSNYQELNIVYEKYKNQGLSFPQLIL